MGSVRAARETAPASPPAPTPGTGGRTAWLLAGQELLRDGGYRSVKLSALCERTGLTTGSFYHHFGGMSEYLTELASYFGSEQPRSTLDRLSDLAPDRRLRKLEKLSVELHMGALHRAMRDWATVDVTAAVAVNEADRVLLEFLRDAFAGMGLSRADAELRAEIVFSLAVTRLDTPWTRRSTSVQRVTDALLLPTRDGARA